MARPWALDLDLYQTCIDRIFPRWLQERGGVVVYENHMMDSSHLGELAFMPARYYPEEDPNNLHDAPNRVGDVPSKFQEKVDHIKLEDFGGDLGKALQCFIKQPDRQTP